MQNYSNFLSHTHMEQLLSESGINGTTAREAKLFSVNEEQCAQIIGMNHSGIAFPYYDQMGKPCGFRVKLDEPFENDKGKLTKYLTAKDSNAFIYFNLEDLERIKQSNILAICEGEKKLLKARQELGHLGYGFVSIAGCNMYRTKGLPVDELHPALESFIIGKNEVVLFPDSDYFENLNVKIAYNRLMKILVRKGIVVKIIDLRLDGINEKIGLDDFLMQDNDKIIFDRVENPYAVFGNISDLELEKLIGKKTTREISRTIRTLTFSTSIDIDRRIEKIKKLAAIPSKKVIKDELKRLSSEFPTELPKQASVSWDPSTESIDMICKAVAFQVSRISNLYFDESNPPRLIRSTDDYSHILKMLLKDDLGDFVNSSLSFQKERTNSEGMPLPSEFSQVSKEIISTLFSNITKYLKLPILKHVSNTPLLINGNLLRVRGFNQELGILLKEDFEAQAICSNKLIEFLENTPFDSESSRDNFLAIMFSCVFMTYSFSGSFPGLIINASSPASGKTSLAKALVYLVDNTSIGTVGFKQDEEMEKEVATRSKTDNAIIIDNIRQNSISSQLLERCLTDENLEFRIFHSQSKMTRRNTIQFVFTMNGGSLSPDLASRCIFVNLDKTKITNVDFDPILFVKKYRKEIINDLLLMMGIFLENPEIVKTRINSRFKSWADLTNSILISNGFTSFLKNTQEMIEKFDEKTNLILMALIQKGDTNIFDYSALEIANAVTEIQNFKGMKVSSHMVASKLKPLLNKKFQFHHPTEGFYEVEISRIKDSIRGGNNSKYHIQISLVDHQA